MPYVPPVNDRPTGGPPVTPVRPVVETLWGRRITDPYRWMEAQGPEWLAYMRAQGAYAAKVLTALPGRDALAAAIGKNTGAVAQVVRVQSGGDKLFIERRPAGADLTKLFLRAGARGAETLLIDPDSYTEPGTHAALDWWEAAPDGAHVVFGISTGGSERSVLRVLDVARQAVLPETIDRTNWASPSWLPDGAGFFYNRLQDVPPSSLDYEKNSLCWLHRLGTDPAQDVKIFGRGVDAAVAVQEIDAPGVVATPGSALAIGVLETGVQNELTLYAAKLADVLAGRPGWVKICGPEDAVTDFAVRGAEVFLLTHKQAPRFKVLKISAAAPHIAHATEVVAQSKAVIRAIATARDGLYIRDLDAGLAGLRHMDAAGALRQIALPFAGAIDAESFYADTLHDGVWFSLESWVKPQLICHAASSGQVMPTDIAPPPAIDVSPYVAVESFATARDGVRVPLSIISRRTTKRDGSAPLLMEAYGAYGITLDPSFLARWLPFLDAGGIFAVAHVRGGGELGENWHRAGQKAQKYHTWQDAEDCVLHLIQAGYTSHRRAAVIGGSAGGITVGRLLTERPELVAVVVDMVGVSDPLRSEFSPNGPPNIPEFGTVKTEQGFRDLLAMDAYQHVHDGVKYPAVLLTTGMNDPRVAAWEPAKMAARLQAATASGNPVLLRVEEDAGHGIGSTRAQRDEETADIMAFVLWRTGDPSYQPKGFS
jgi:prolyl oligopeptidase